ncbi:hypothetical protein [Nitratifractor sp.]
MMEEREQKLFVTILFYLLTLMLILLLGAVFYPSASVLREIGRRTEQGMAILVPVSFLLLSFIYGFIRARRHLQAAHWVACFGWLLGSAALAIVLLYLYLKEMSGH